MDTRDIENRFTYHPPSAENEEAVFWANAAIARNE